MGVTVETQENIVSTKVREQNILKLANTQRVNIQSKNVWSFGLLWEEILLNVSILKGILTSNK